MLGIFEKNTRTRTRSGKNTRTRNTRTRIPVLEQNSYTSTVAKVFSTRLAIQYIGESAITGDTKSRRLQYIIIG